jgi:hypothetical protein
MSRRKLTPEVVRRVQEAKRFGRSYADISAEFGISVGSVSAALKAGQNRPVPASPAAETPPAQPERPGSPDGAPALDSEDHRGLVNETIAVMRAAMADAGVTPSEKSTYARSLALLVNLSYRMSPPTPPDPNASPDLIKRAKAVVAKLHAMIDHETAAAGPRSSP